MPRVPPIATVDIRPEFEYVRTLDVGNGRGGGFMNAGVFVVRRRVDNLLCVEKRYQSKTAQKVGWPEISMLHEIRHPNICRYIDAFFMPASISYPKDVASLYIELCDLGSLERVIKNYQVRGKGLAVPEAFLWHFYLSMMRALAYLHSGVTDHRLPPCPGWSTILHRDIKPGNVFLKSPQPHTGIFYPTIVLGDFGLVSTREIDPDFGRRDMRGAAGTLVWQPPEIPYHVTNGKSDVWSAGAIVTQLARLDGPPVGPAPPGICQRDWDLMPEARQIRSLGRRYSPVLNTIHSCSQAIDYHQRWTSLDLLREIERHLDVYDLPAEALPDWVYKKV